MRANTKTQRHKDTKAGRNMSIAACLCVVVPSCLCVNYCDDLSTSSFDTMCSSINSRTDRGFDVSSFSFSGGTFGGGGGGGVPRMFSRIHLPRRTGEVRFG